MLDLNQIRYPVRYTTFFLALGGLIFSALVVLASGQAWIMLLLFATLSAVGVHDVLQTRHAILRNYPILGHMRFLFEFIRPEIRSISLKTNLKPPLFHVPNEVWCMRVPKVNPTNGRLAPNSMSTKPGLNG